MSLEVGAALCESPESRVTIRGTLGTAVTG